MSLFTRKTVLIAKAEATYGTDPVPTAAANAIQVRNVNLQPQVLDTVDRNLYRNYLGTSPQLVVGQHVELDFEVEITGAEGASNGATPKYDALLQACGFSPTLSAGVSLTYNPVTGSNSVPFKGVTIYVFIDTYKHKISGCMGDVEFDLSIKQVPVMKFKFMGLYQAPVDMGASDLTGLTFTGWGTPLGVNNTNTPTLSLHGQAVYGASFNLKMNNQLTYQSLMGTTGIAGEYVSIVDRNPTGTLTMKALDTIAAKDFFALSKAMTLGALSLVQGTVSKSKFTVASSNVQIMKPTYGDLDGIRMLQVQLGFIPSGAGNNELSVATS